MEDFSIPHIKKIFGQTTFLKNKNKTVYNQNSYFWINYFFSWNSIWKYILIKA